MPDTLFTQPPHWEWLIILYFFLGGIAAGAFAVAVLADFAGGPADRAIARAGYLVAFPLVSVAGLLLIFDLGQPLRFWHMLIASDSGGLIFKYWSPMSVGSWGLVVFGGLAFLCFIGELGVPFLRALPRRGPVGAVLGVVGLIAGLFIAGYTGVLLAVTNQPVWADSSFLGALFLASAASTALAVLLIIVQQRGGSHELLRRLEDADNWVTVVELIVLAAFFATLGGVTSRFLASGWAWLLILGVGVIGCIMPLGLHIAGRRWVASSASASPELVMNPAFAAMLALVGGFLLRYGVIMAGQSL